MAVPDAPSGMNYRFDDIVVDQASFCVYKGRETLTLQPRAFDLLVYLIEHRDRVVEKQELFENVWDENFVTDNALTRAIKDIRRELNDDAAAPRYIATMHKRGYRFVGDLIDERQAELSTESREIAIENEDTHPADAEHLRSSRLNKKALTGLGLMTLALAAVYIFYLSGNTQPVRSLAVLPLENSTGTPDNDYMSDGITESLINSLSRLPQMKVIPRTTAFRYKGKEIDAQRLKSELGVDAFLTGRITIQGENLVVQTELTNTSDGAQFWGERFNRKLSDIFILQEDIAKVISEKLRLRLSGEQAKQLTRRYTENRHAYELFLKGRYHLAKLTPPDVQTSVSYFRQAIDTDPSYALAYVGLADANSALALSIDMPAATFYPKSKDAAQKAIEIDEALAEAHTALGFATQFYDWNFTSAENQYNRALELDPNNADAYFAYASLLTLAGKHEEALSRIGRARELDPLNLRINALEGRFLAIAGRVDEGLARLQKTIELEPNYFLAHLFAAGIYAEMGVYQEAIDEATRARDLSGGNAEAIAWIGYSLAMTGKRDEAQQVLDQLQKRAAERYVPPYNFALVYHGLRERDETFDWLERGFEQRDPKILFLKSGRIWNDLRDDSRYASLLSRINLPDR